MKPFDLEAAKAGKPMQTRDGRKAEFLGYTKSGCKYPVAAWIEDHGITGFTEHGGFRFGLKGNSDLFMVSTRGTVWVNVYERFPGINFVANDTYTSKGEADQRAYTHARRIGAYLIEIDD